jgi:gamma-glutamylcyclotransferase (GGCT)/AIG2-like uncharacterized protein YtfP
MSPTWPTFVYGTLLPDEPNSGLWEGRAVPGPVATVEGFRLVTRGYFPYAIPDADAVTTGVLLRPVAGAALQLQADLDRLEGVPTHYVRRHVIADEAGVAVPCWLYVSAEPDFHGAYPAVPGNDWLLREVTS